MARHEALERSKQRIQCPAATLLPLDPLCRTHSRLWPLEVGELVCTREENNEERHAYMSLSSLLWDCVFEAVRNGNHY